MPGTESSCRTSAGGPGCVTPTSALLCSKLAQWSLRALVILLVASVVQSCDHSAPLDVAEQLPLDPRGATLPIRLTYNPSDDIDPAVGGDMIVYSLLEPGREDRDRCLGYLPTAGGTRLALRCPGGAVADSTLDAWLQPAVSDDGRIAYVLQRSSVLAETPSLRRIVVAPLEAPDSALFEASAFFDLADGRRAFDLRALAWTESGALRFVAGKDSFPKPDGVRDTLFQPLRLVELDLTTGSITEIAGTDGVIAHAPAPDGGIWFVMESTPRVLWHRPPGGSSPDSIGAFSGAVSHVANIDGLPVGVQPGPDTSLVEILDLGTGMSAATIVVIGRASQIAPIPGSRSFVLQLITNMHPDLWLLALP